ncbi:hypothetical protein [Arsukibacterium sp.]|uniref:hypothetical protein n=1 Tax=Arsukibacterium sp. TaxID=1977258 RepID=UPI0026370A8C|nr:hypothetical protein [Arsukibacterium sp.]
MLRWLKAHCDAILATLPAQRLLALDALRGLTITAMILVNNPGSWSHVYGPLRHAEWHGWTVTDLIFPFLLLLSACRCNSACASSAVRLKAVRPTASLFAMQQYAA